MISNVCSTKYVTLIFFPFLHYIIKFKSRVQFNQDLETWLLVPVCNWVLIHITSRFFHRQFQGSILNHILALMTLSPTAQLPNNSIQDRYDSRYLLNMTRKYGITFLQKSPDQRTLVRVGRQRRLQQKQV